MFSLLWSSLQRFWRAGASSLTAQSRVCCCSLWAARPDPVETKVRCSSESIPEWCTCVCPWPEVNGRCLSFLVYLLAETYNLLVTSTIEMAVVYRSDLRCSANVDKKPLFWSDLCVCFCICSEMSSRGDCPGPCSCQRVISGTLCFALWSSTWILTGRGRCCWEHMARSQLFFLMHFYPR